MHKQPRRLSLGQIVATRGAIQRLSREVISTALLRHHSCDWGTICEEDWETNDLAREQGERILSAYSDQSGETFWIITEADRSVTTVLLPSEY